MKDSPKVSCIMPTANRTEYIKLAIYYFRNQDYHDAELIIIDDGTADVRSLLPQDPRIRYFFVKPTMRIGGKRNYACSKAYGEIILHWDDDDYYAPDWISKSLHSFEGSDADVSGLNEFHFFSPLENKFWRYSDKNTLKPFLAGATLTYKKEFWKSHPFKDIDIGEDYEYIWNGTNLYAHDYIEGFVAILHNSNITLKPFENPFLKKSSNLFLDSTLQNSAAIDEV